jgi:hypothetical protein
MLRCYHTSGKGVFRSFRPASAFLRHSAREIPPGFTERLFVRLLFESAFAAAPLDDAGEAAFDLFITPL